MRRRLWRCLHTVKAGVTRAELNAVFLPEGGLHTSSAQTYHYRGCPYFKVRVTFQGLGSGAEVPVNPKDKFLSISEPVVNTLSQPNRPRSHSAQGIIETHEAT